MRRIFSSANTCRMKGVHLTCIRPAVVSMDNAMHHPGGDTEERPADTVEGGETWSQYETKMRHHHRRIRVFETTARMSYEYKLLHQMCKKRPFLRQWTVRDDLCKMDPGVIEMSPSMQAAYMRVYRSKSKGEVRTALRDIIPIIEYRNTEQKQALLPKDNPEALIPTEEPDTLNQKKRELYERRDVTSKYKTERLIDERSLNKLRWKIRMKLIRFQRKVAIANAAANRSVLYSEPDAIGYFLFRGPAMYAAVHRVLFELSKLMPWFVPKTMLDFGSGTGTAIMAAKEVYDPQGLAYPVFRNRRTNSAHNRSAEAWSLTELNKDLKRLQATREEKKRARFLAVSALIEKGEVSLDDIPADLRREIITVAANAAKRAKERERHEKIARLREIVSGREWDKGLEEILDADEKADDTVIPGEETPTGDDVDAKPPEKTWWEKYMDAENDKESIKAARRLRPLQQIVAVDPAPGMMDTGITVTHEDCPGIVWKRYLTPEDTDQHDLVIAAYTLSEMATPEMRRRTVQQLWKITRGVLILIEHANMPNFDILMKARDTILEEKGFGLWDWQPTIVAPCPHEHRCPMRYSAIGVKKKSQRVCSVSVRYRSTFIERWARQLPLIQSLEPFSYLIFTRNELIPERAERRERQLAEEEKEKTAKRDAEQRQLYEKSLALEDTVFERLSEESLHRPDTDMPPPTVRPDENSETEISQGSTPNDQPPVRFLPSDKAIYVQKSQNLVHRLIYPKHLPVATHKYNRNSFVDSAYQKQRPVSPSEMLVVRSERNDLNEHFVSKTPHYFRFVRNAECRGRVKCELCTSDGELIRAKVYRRYYGDMSKPKQNTEMSKWQYAGGWKLASRAKAGYLFPDDVPLYNILRRRQVNFPNTLLDRSMSSVEKTAMMHDTPMDPTVVPKDDSAEPEDGDESFQVPPDHDVSPRQRVKQELNKIVQERFDQQLRGLFGAGAAGGSTPTVNIDTQAEITGLQWDSAVKNAKRRMNTWVREKKSKTVSPMPRRYTNRLRYRGLVR